jgi:hypothetical protein
MVYARTCSAISGGYTSIPIASLMACWWACRAAPLRTGDLRTWLAAHEMRARRCQLKDGQAANYNVAELARLTGVSQRTALASLRRLANAGLVVWSPSEITFPDPPEGYDHGLGDTISGGKGQLVIPRRMLKHLVRETSVAFIATVLGLLLRCLSRRRGGFDGAGRLKSSWVAEVFGVDIRAVKLARKELIRLGWITAEPGDQRVEQRYGRRFVINLNWVAPRPQLSTTVDGPGRHARPPLDGPEVTRQTTPLPIEPDILYREEEKNQTTSKAGGTGFSVSGQGTGDGGTAAHTDSVPVGIKSVPASAVPAPTVTTTRPTSTPATSQAPAPPLPTPAPSQQAAPLPAPTLRDIRIEDLKQTDRLLDLHHQAVEQGIVGGSEADRLRFIGAAEHALGIGKTNPCGLFAYLIRGKLWRYLTQADEDRANVRIKFFERGHRPPMMGGYRDSPGITASRPVLSDDALVARRVLAALASAKFKGDPFPQVRRADPSWTRPRWDAAVAELGLCG